MEVASDIKLGGQRATTNDNPIIEPEQKVSHVDFTNDPSRSNSPIIDENDGASKFGKPDPKVCGVCGDKALGNNFNAITCESCKAFFRRNALKPKEFVCPFNGNCKVDPVTRRFCQKCRLKKCFDIGMKKEWIMTPEEKLMKKQKIEQNRLKRQSTDQLPLTGSEAPPSKAACLIDPNTSLMSPMSHHQNSPPDPTIPQHVSNQPTMPHHSGTRSDQYIIHHYQQQAVTGTSLISNLLDMSPSSSNSSEMMGVAVVTSVGMGPSCNQNNGGSLGPNCNQSNIGGMGPNCTQNSVIGMGPNCNQIGSGGMEPNCNQSNGGGMGLNCNQSGNGRMDANCQPNINGGVGLNCTQNGGGGMVPNCPQKCNSGIGSNYTQNSNNGMGVNCNRNVNGGGMSQMDQMKGVINHSIIPHIKSEVDCLSPNPLNTMDSILSVAIKAEFNAFGVMGRSNDPMSKELNGAERAKLNELLIACQALNAPVDEEAPVTVNKTSDPSLINVINLTDIAIRRLIKMSKKISGFKNLCQEDQIALLKGSCTEMMILRSVVTYDPDRDSWNIPHSFGYNIKLGVLKEAPGNLYEEHQRFVKSFRPEWRSDENIMIILCAITLFTAERPNVVHKDVIKLEQDSYYYLLKRYLESTYNGCEARSIYLELIRKIAELHILNSNHLRVFLEVNPREVEPLLIEIFDLK